jgi:quercetin dioxygenase-like cupin family protein
MRPPPDPASCESIPAASHHKEAGMAFWNLDTLVLAPFRPGIMSQAQSGADLILVCMEIEAGKEDAGHAHPFDQCGIVLAGEIEMYIGEERRRLGTNGCYFIPAGERHGWKTFDQPARLLDIALKSPRS